MYLRIIYILAVIACMPVVSIARHGAEAYSFLNISQSSHVYGLGGINISMIDDDIMLVQQNPALLGPEIERQLGVSYMRYIGSADFAGVAYGQALGERSAWAGGIRYFGYGKMDETDAEGNIIGSFSAKDIVASASFSHDITDRWRGGITVNTVYSAYAEFTAWALAADLGVNYYDPDADMSLSLVAANLGGQIKRFDKAYGRMPFRLNLGWTQTLRSIPLRLSVTAYDLTSWKSEYYDVGDGSEASVITRKRSFASDLFRHLVFGAEFVPSESFYVGVGYNYRVRTDMSGYSRNLLSGLSCCVGFDTERFGVGAALSRPHTGATTFMVNLRLRMF